jgi:hypothetical protein
MSIQGLIVEMLKVGGMFEGETVGSQKLEVGRTRKELAFCDQRLGFGQNQNRGWN